MLNERRELRAEGCGVLLAQVDLVLGATEPETQRLGSRAAVYVIFEFDGSPSEPSSTSVPAIVSTGPSVAIIRYAACNVADHTLCSEFPLRLRVLLAWPPA
jgi:hypothetical protein